QIASSSSCPRPRRSPRALCRRSERVSNKAGKCTYGLFSARLRPVSEHSERKLATVLFADLVDSTAAAGDQDPERTRARLERFYDAMSAQIEAAGGPARQF